MRILVVGAGANGGYFGAGLLQAGAAPPFSRAAMKLFCRR
jgi:ketopantoate reductase